jgi:hypothetical protein
MQNRHAQSYQGQTSMTKLTTAIFSYINTTWKIRCDAQHGKTQMDIDNKIKFQIYPRIQALYAAKPRLTNIDQLQFDHPIEAIIALPLSHLEHWLTRTTKIVKAGLRRSALQQRLQTPSIQTFFPPKTNRIRRTPIPITPRNRNVQAHRSSTVQQHQPPHSDHPTPEQLKIAKHQLSAHPSGHPNKCKPP